MTALVAPDATRWQSWAATLEDFYSQGGPEDLHGSGAWFLDGAPVPTEDGCAAFVAMTELTSSPDLDGTRVPNTYYWITATDGGPADEVIGFLNLRHVLNEFLFEQGGHVGYSVRPSARRRGHASAALGLAVEQAAGIGIERVLVTCEVDNVASRGTIEKGGGVLEDERHGKLRFWITT